MQAPVTAKTIYILSKIRYIKFVNLTECQMATLSLDSSTDLCIFNEPDTSDCLSVFHSTPVDDLYCQRNPRTNPDFLASASFWRSLYVLVALLLPKRKQSCSFQDSETLIYISGALHLVAHVQRQLCQRVVSAPLDCTVIREHR